MNVLMLSKNAEAVAPNSRKVPPHQKMDVTAGRRKLAAVINADRA